MILFFGDPNAHIFSLETTAALSAADRAKLHWLFGNQPQIEAQNIEGQYVGPRKTMITPWSTNAVEITQNMGLTGIKRIEKYIPKVEGAINDPMVTQIYEGLDQELFSINIDPEPIIPISDIAAYNKQEGLALSSDEINYLEAVSERIGRPLTDSEVFGFSQVNSEHCRHKIFNGQFIIDGQEMPASLFQLIKETSKKNPNGIVSAYKDNVAFVEGAEVTQFAPRTGHEPDYYQKEKFDAIISIKAETHNFPTTVEPFSGAATGSGGEIRDRMAGGQGSIPLAGTALYMTAYSRLDETNNETKGMPARDWLYQTPIDILIKASNGASDFGNKFGQPLINGSVLTFEHEENGKQYGYDKVIMMAGGVGYAKKEQAQKAIPKPGDKIIILGGDNYRIGMGGAAVSSSEGGSFGSGIELNAIQRSNPEMQKRAANTIRALVEQTRNPIISIHDHGAGGHLNCLSELVEETGGKIFLDKLPLGDPTLSAKEIIGNESQERMGLIISKEDLPMLREIAERERSPIYEVGEITGDNRFIITSSDGAVVPIDLGMEDFFGSSPRTIMSDTRKDTTFASLSYDEQHINKYLENVLRMESVACKDWLTNKVDRCVGGRVAKQQCCGELQLPLNNCGVMALDYDSTHGIATSMGHAPVSALIDAAAGSRAAITEALTNIIWAPLEKGIQSLSLSANWMWPAKNEGEDARLYEAVEAVSKFAIALGINIPTGKDSMSMKQKYPNGNVYAPGTVVISAVGHCDDITQVVEPVLKADGGDIYYINLSQDDYKLGGSTFAQVQHKIGSATPDVTNAEYLAKCFDAIQGQIRAGNLTAGHDISAGGMITTLLELCFPSQQLGADIDLSEINEDDIVKLLFSENAGLILQSKNKELAQELKQQNITCYRIGTVTNNPVLDLVKGDKKMSFDIESLRDVWFRTSYLLDKKQSAGTTSKQRFENYKNQPLQFHFPKDFNGQVPQVDSNMPRPKAAVLREKGSNSERELAHAMYLAGFDVKDIHMTDLISGRETLEDIQFLGAVGGFSNSDVLGSAKGWAGSFLYNDKAKKALDNFFSRDDVLSVGICNGCQLMMELELIHPELDTHGKMHFNDSHKHESSFTSVTIQNNPSIMLGNMAGSTLGVWISHGEGKFLLSEDENKYNIVAKYGYDSYPANPNGSDYNTAMMCSADGRHLVMMPHIERSMFRWNWAYYDESRDDVISPWVQAFINAKNYFQKG